METLLSVAKVAALIGWNTSTVYRKALEGEIPGCVKLGGSVRFRESKIKAWIDGAGSQRRRTRTEGVRLEDGRQ